MGNRRFRGNGFARRATQGGRSPTTTSMISEREDDDFVGFVSKPEFCRPPRGRRRRSAQPLGRGQVNRR